MTISILPRLPKACFVPALIVAAVVFGLSSARANLPVATSANLTSVFPSSTSVVATGQTAGGTGLLTLTASSATISVVTWGNFWDGSTAGGTSAPGDTITFTLPGATSSILNVIGGSSPTTINGVITSNGKVYLLNSNGIVIGATGSINVAGFYASTVGEPASYFESTGNLQVFTSTPPVVTTAGTITVTNGAVITTAGSNGDIRLAGNGITVQGGTLTGNVYLVDTGAGTPAAVDVGTVAAVSVTGTSPAGNLNITTTNGAVNLADGFATSVSGNMVITTSGAAVSLANATKTTTVTGTSSITTTGTSTNGNVTGPGTFASGATTITTGTGSGATDGTVNIAAVQLGTNPITVTGGATTLTDTADTTLTLGNMTLSGNLTLTATNNITTQNFGSTAVTPAVVTQNGTGLTLALTADSGGLGSRTLTFNGSGSENFTTLVAGIAGAADSATITTTGNINIGTTTAVSIPALSLASTGGAITQGSAAAQAVAANTLLTVNAPTVTLNNAHNDLSGKVVLIGGGTGGITLTDLAPTLTIGNGTSVTGNATITNAGSGVNDNIALGAADADTLSFGGNLTLALTTGSAGTEQITTAAGTITVSGNTTITGSGLGASAAANSITLGNSGATPTQAYTFTGPISASIAGAAGGTVSIFGNSGLSLGAITTGPAVGDTLTVQSALTGSGNSGISNSSGVVSVGGTTTLAAGTLASASNIQIGGTTNPAALTGDIVVGIGTAEANNVSVTNSLATKLDTSSNTNVITGQTTITQSGAGAASAVTVGGTIDGAIPNLSISDTGSAPTGNVSVLTTTGNVALSNWGVFGSGVTVGVTTTNGSITLGSGINDGNTATTTLTAAGANGAFADTASSPVLIYGAVTFNSSGPINISNNTSSSLGAITLNLTGVSNNNNITYTEGSGVKILGISVADPGYSGAVAISSVNSVLLESDTSNLSLPSTATLTLTANSANGQVLLNDALSTNAILAPVSINATGNSALTLTNNMQIAGANITAGTLTATANSTAGLTITEPSGDSMTVSGAVTLITRGGTISLNQSGNSFGPLTIDATNSGGTVAAAGANVTITSSPTATFTSVKTGTAGTFTATSSAGSLTETGNAGVQVGGATSLTANTGGITFNATGNNFNGQGISVITTSGNASLADSNAVTQLGSGTDVGGGLTVTNTTATGEIEDNGLSGNITVGGVATFLLPTSTASFIDITGANNSIAGLKVNAGTGTSKFYDNSALVIEGGTVVVGSITISAGGNLTLGTGPISFGSALILNGNANITFGDTGASFSGQVTATVTGSSSDVNFGALSLATNFSNISPSVTTANNSLYYQAPGP